jgi:hypothetical protein
MRGVEVKVVREERLGGRRWSALPRVAKLGLFRDVCRRIASSRGATASVHKLPCLWKKRHNVEQTEGEGSELCGTEEGPIGRRVVVV